MNPWPRRRLKYLVKINQRSLREDEDPGLAFRYVDIGAVGRGVLVAEPEEVTFENAPSRARRLVLLGDTIISTVRTYLRAVWPVAGDQHDLVVSTGFAVITPNKSINARYLGWLAQSDAFVEEIVARSVGVSYPAINPSEIGQLTMPVPPWTAQCAIANYLDAETDRIDALIAKKRRMMVLIGDRRSAVIEQTIRTLVDRYGSTPLKRAVRRIEVGIVVTPAAWYVDEGVLALRGVNVKPGHIVLDDVVKISNEGHRLHNKSELRAGDVVVVRTGQAGAAAVIPESLDGCNCIDLVIVRPTVGLTPKFLEFVLNSDWTQKHIDEFSVGTIQSHFNVGAMKDLPIPVPTLDDQNRAVEDLVLATNKLDQLSSKLVSQVNLLAEHRQALITAAVTGELDIPERAA